MRVRERKKTAKVNSAVFGVGISELLFCFILCV